MHSSSLQTRISRKSVSRAMGASNPELVVMSGTDRTYSIALALIAAMMRSPLSNSGPVPALATDAPPQAPTTFSLLKVNRNALSKKPARRPAFTQFRFEARYLWCRAGAGGVPSVQASCGNIASTI